MHFVLFFILFICAVLIMLPVLEDLVQYLKCAMSSLFCIDLIDAPYSKNNVSSLMRHLSLSKHKLSRKLISSSPEKILCLLKQANPSSNAIRFELKNGEVKEASMYSVALRNVLLSRPDLLPEIESFIVKKKPSLVFDFAVATSDMEFSRKNLFLSLSRGGDPGYRNAFIDMFKNDEEIEKLASLI